MSNNIANPDPPNLPYYVATYQGRSVAIKRDADYHNTIKLVQKSIAKLRSVDVQDILISTTLADYGGALIQTSEEIWPDIVGDVRTVEINLDDPTDAGHPASGRVDDGEDESVVPVQTDVQVAAVVTAAEPITRRMCFTLPRPIDSRHFTSHLQQNPHEYIALRFVPQADCETISSLSVSLPTERIIRVLVLYKGLSAVAARIWDIPQPKYAEGAGVWKDIVGIEPRNYWHNSYQAGLRVLEIAWMEVC